MRSRREQGRPGAAPAFRWPFTRPATATFSIRQLVSATFDGRRQGPRIPVLGITSAYGGLDPRQRYAPAVYLAAPQTLAAGRLQPEVAPVPAVNAKLTARVPVHNQHGRLRRGGQRQVVQPRATIVYPAYGEG